MDRSWRDSMRALIAGGGMAGLMTALALRESGVFTTIDVFEQTRTPSTAGAGLNIPPNGARLSRWLGVDLDGGDPKGPHGAIDGGRAAILHETRMGWEGGSITRKPLDHNTSAADNAGFHHMHRMDLLMCLHKRVLEFAPETGADCPIRVHMAKRVEAVGQDEESVTVTFSDGTTETGDLLIGADGVNSQVLEAVWPGVSTKRWTEVVVYRGLVARDKVAARASPTAARSTSTPSRRCRWTLARRRRRSTSRTGSAAASCSTCGSPTTSPTPTSSSAKRAIGSPPTATRWSAT